MAETSKKEAGQGCMGKIGLLFLIALFGGMIAAVYFVIRPQNLEDVGGYHAVEGDISRDLVVVLEKSLEKGHPLALTEKEINLWLSRALSSRQGGLAAKWVTLDGVWVRLLDGHAEIIQERTVMGQSFTVSLFVSIERKLEAGRIYKQVHLHSGPYHKDVPRPVRGGRFGRLVVPQGFLIFVMPSFEKLKNEFQKEIKLGIQEMSVVRFENRRLILQPRDLENP